MVILLGIIVYIIFDPFSFKQQPTKELKEEYTQPTISYKQPSVTFNIPNTNVYENNQPQEVHNENIQETTELFQLSDGAENYQG